jgi:hypothetical protein
MSQAISNPAHLQVGKTYTFTRAINGFSYKATLTGTAQSRRPTQEAQWIGNNNPLETVYEFNCEYPNGAKSPMWVWTHDVVDGAYPDGHWTV